MSVDEEELQDLVDKWRDIADSKMRSSSNRTGCTGAYCMALERCADDLEEIQ